MKAEEILFIVLVLAFYFKMKKTKNNAIYIN